MADKIFQAKDTVNSSTTEDHGYSRNTSLGTN